VTQRKHSLETRRKIAAGNTGKVFSFERCHAISEARTLRLSATQLQELQQLWDKKHLNPKVIMELTDIKTAAVYRRFFDAYCTVKQTKFMPSNLYPDELDKLIELASQGIHYKEIARQVNRGEKQVCGMIKRIGMTPVTKGFRASKWSSKLEIEVGEALQSRGHKLTPGFHIRPFYYDYYVDGTSTLIEVHGDYWHCNPKKYSGDFIHKNLNMKAKEKWELDSNRINTIKNMGFNTLIIWENDWKNNKEELLKSVG